MVCESTISHPYNITHWGNTDIKVFCQKYGDIWFCLHRPIVWWLSRLSLPLINCLFYEGDAGNSGVIVKLNDTHALFTHNIF